MNKVIIIYCIALVMMTIGMIAITQRMLTLERSERLQALKGENERLALWRIESQGLPLILRESSRRYDDSLFNNSFGEFDSDAIVRREQTQSFPEEVLCFLRGDEFRGVEQFIWDTSRDWELEPIDEAQQTRLAAQPTVLRQVAQEIRNPSFIAALGVPSTADAAQDSQRMLTQTAPQVEPQENFLGAAKQAARNQSEFLNRSQNARANSMIFDQIQVQSRSLQAELPLAPLHPVWLNDHLYLVRWSDGGKQRAFEGCLLDWGHLQTALLEPVRDLLPNASLVQLRAEESSDHHSLASLPLRLVPGEPNLKDLQFSSALGPTLAVAWACFLSSGIAIGVLLVGVVRLSERRAAFVSAVTHELRTPLTTFRLYTDLLASPGTLAKEKHSRYIETLKSEAERLQYLIENVLDWSRLERSAETQLVEVIDWTEFIEAIERSLRERANQAGMLLVVDQADGESIALRGNKTAVERVLFNLVDNACKYAQQAEDRRVHIELVNDGSKQVSILVRDHGPGIAKEMRGRLFKPFSKSAQQAARSAPGIGLGLSLSRRLARDMSGDLVLKLTSATGTIMELKLPQG